MLLDSSNFRVQLEQNMKHSIIAMFYSAFFTYPAAKWMTEYRKFSNDDRLLIRARPTDFISGSCSFSAIKMLQELGLNVKMSSALHAKIYAFDDIVFAGSGNLTSNGMALSENHNQELGVKADLTNEDRTLLDNLWMQAVNITPEILLKMEAHCEDQNLKDVNPDRLSITWPEDIVIEKRDIYCSDFPQEYPSNDIRWSSELNFKQTAAYVWLKKAIEDYGDASFGRLSSLLHDTVFDDPTPYRRDIKTLLSNLLSVVIEYDLSCLEVVRPRYSQIVKFR